MLLCEQENMYWLEKLFFFTFLVAMLCWVSPTMAEKKILVYSLNVPHELKDLNTNYLSILKTTLRTTDDYIVLAEPPMSFSQMSLALGCKLKQQSCISKIGVSVGASDMLRLQLKEENNVYFFKLTQHNLIDNTTVFSEVFTFSKFADPQDIEFLFSKRVEGLYGAYDEPVGIFRPVLADGISVYQIFINGKQIEPKRSYILTPGEYRISISHPDGNVWSNNITVQENEIVMQKITFGKTDIENSDTAFNKNISQDAKNFDRELTSSAQTKSASMLTWGLAGFGSILMIPATLLQLKNIELHQEINQASDEHQRLFAEANLFASKNRASLTTEEKEIEKRRDDAYETAQRIEVENTEKGNKNMMNSRIFFGFGGASLAMSLYWYYYQDLKPAQPIISSSTYFFSTGASFILTGSFFYFSKLPNEAASQKEKTSSLVLMGIGTAFIGAGVSTYLLEEEFHRSIKMMPLFSFDYYNHEVTPTFGVFLTY